MAQPWLVDPKELPEDVLARVEAAALASGTTVERVIAEAAENRLNDEDARAAVARQFGHASSPGSSRQASAGAPGPETERVSKSAQQSAPRSPEEPAVGPDRTAASRPVDGFSAEMDAEEGGESSVLLKSVPSRYSLSPSVLEIVETAAQFAASTSDGLIVGAGTLFRATVHSARHSGEPQWSRDELRLFVQKHCDPATFQRNFQPAAATPGLSPGPVLTRRAEEVFHAARTIAESTTGSPMIYIRHLVAAFLVPVPGSQVVAYMTRSRAARGVDIRPFVPVMLLYLERKYSQTTERLDVWRGLLRQGQALQGDPYQNRRTYSRYDADSVPPKDDALDITRDVQAFAELICLNDINGSLSIGLFGDWGSGKTTFMNRLADEIKKLTNRFKDAENDKRVAAAKAKQQKRPLPASVPPPFIKDVVQIKFNAWHYADGDIWASLTAEFFDQLRAGGFEGVDDHRFKGLVGEVAAHVSKQQGIAVSAEATAKGLAEEALAAREVLEKSRRQLSRVEERTFAESAADIVAGFAGSNKDKIDKAGDAIGIANLSDQLGSVQHELSAAQSTLGQLTLLLRAVARPNSTKGVLFYLAVLILLGGVFAVPHLDLSRAAEFWARIVSMMGGAGVAASFAWRGFKAVQPLIKQAAEVAERYEENRKELVGKIQAHEKQLAELESQYRVAQARAKTQRDYVESYPPQVSDQSHRALLRYFLHDSLETRGYEKHLGVISQARKAFETLNTIVLRHRDQGAESLDDLPDIDRIVLYIDDLDRCRHEQVVKVLEAVHLLLAFDLFVVVVGVDARWMRQALAKYYEGEFGGATGDAATRRATPGDTATPDDYLEKIFQVPFWLKPLTAGTQGTYRKLITSLTNADAKASDEQKSDDGRPPPANVSGATSEPNPPPGDPLATPTPKPNAAAPPPPDEPDAGIEAAAERVRMTPDEIKLLSAMGPLAGKSPRAVKRLVNVYRLIRSRRSGQGLRQFLGETEEPGDFIAVILLLALSTGLPPEALSRFIAIASADGDEFRLLKEELEKRRRPDGLSAPPRSELPSLFRDHPGILPCLDAAFAANERTISAALLKTLGPVVSRYSFHRPDGAPMGASASGQMP